jgi:hypothetical protein
MVKIHLEQERLYIRDSYLFHQKNEAEVGEPEKNEVKLNELYYGLRTGAFV